MLIEDLNKLLEKYDKLRSIANSGSSDKDIKLKFKYLRRIFEYKLLKQFSISLYAVPFASNNIRKEIRYTLNNILKLCEINYLRTERTSEFSKETIVIIKEYLNDVPKPYSLKNRLNDNSWNILTFIIGLIPILISIGLPTIQYILLIIGLAILIPFLIPYLTFHVIIYFEERVWYKKWMNLLAIKDLKHKIITELVNLNDETYVELEAKCKSLDHHKKYDIDSS